MLQFRLILVTVLTLAIILAGLSACGQTGPLYLPAEPAPPIRATLPQSLLPATQEQAPSSDTPAPTPAAPTPPSQ